jgi:hypothetical protein
MASSATEVVAALPVVETESEPALFLPPQQLEFLPGEASGTQATSSTFSDNLSLPVHRWFRYSAGFSATWARGLIAEQVGLGRRRILDPFAGSATVLLETERFMAEGKGIEAHPFVLRVAKAKLQWRESPRSFLQAAAEVLKVARTKPFKMIDYPALITKCFPAANLIKLNALKHAWHERADGGPLSELCWLALASILRECSPVGTAQWQYVLPKKSKVRSADPFEAFQTKIYGMCADMAARQTDTCGPHALICRDDARECASIPEGWADLVVTSPPYANNYDYADATRLEMCFFGEVESWGGLQDAVRKHLVRSCTQHVAALRQGLHTYLENPLLAPIAKEIREVCQKLEIERESHGGKKPYHLMVAAYFSDLARVWKTLRQVCAHGALVCFVIGDSAPYGIYVPVDRWLGELAVSVGFKSFRFEKTRDRNIKWKNRKHRVPLHEGRLWVQG